MPPKIQNILALDLSLACTGWAALSESGIESGAKSFPLQKKTDPAQRYNDFDTWLRDVFDLQKPARVVYEQAHHRGRDATEAACGLVTRVKALCALRNIPYQSIHSATLKKHATGSGNADKAAMKTAAEKKWSFYDASADKGGDEADALWLLDYATGIV